MGVLERHPEEGRIVVIILLDAFSSSYLKPEYCPFLYQISQKGLTISLKPMFAFEGISASILSGTLPNKNKIWLDYVFKEEVSRSRLFEGLVKISDTVPNDDFDKYSRFLLHKIFRRPIATPNLIPPDLLSYFEPKVEEYRASAGITTLFDQLDKYGVKYYVSGLFEALPDRLVTWKFTRSFSEDRSFFMLKLTDLDRLGHKYGPRSREIVRRVAQMDKTLSMIVKKFSERRRRISFMIFSDHGMSPVSHCVDLLGLLGELHYNIPNDYILFLGSTIANFLFFSKEARRDVSDLLARLRFGKVLKEVELSEFGICNGDREYGELFFALNEGLVFFPDFYRRLRPPKGMHGYFRSSYDAPIFLIYTLDSSTVFAGRTAQYVDIMPTVLNLLHLPIPKAIDGKSLLISH